MSKQSEKGKKILSDLDKGITTISIGIKSSLVKDNALSLVYKTDNELLDDHLKWEIVLHNIVEEMLDGLKVYVK